MSISISCKKTGRDITVDTGGFLRLRRDIALYCYKEWGEHYTELMSFPLLKGKEWYKAFDRKTLELINRRKVSKKFVYFCLQPDAGGSIAPGTCKMIYDRIKDYDNDAIYGYHGKPNPCKLCDFKKILKECIDTKSRLEWW